MGLVGVFLSVTAIVVGISVLKDVAEVVDTLVGCGDFEIGAVLDNRLEDVTYISILKDLDALVDNLKI